MGNKPGTPTIRNSSKYHIKVTGHKEFTLSPGQLHNFQVTSDNFHVSITAFQNGRSMKGMSLTSWKHHSWDILNNYVQRHGDARMGHPQSEYRYWEWDNTGYWEKKDREERERLERERLERERKERERLERERLERERLERERQERERLERERLERERLEKERLERERLEKEENERREAELERQIEEAFRKFEEEASEKNKLEWEEAERRLEEERNSQKLIEHIKNVDKGKDITGDEDNASREETKGVLSREVFLKFLETAVKKLNDEVAGKAEILEKVHAAMDQPWLNLESLLLNYKEPAGQISLKNLIAKLFFDPEIQKQGVFPLNEISVALDKYSEDAKLVSTLSSVWSQLLQTKFDETVRELKFLKEARVEINQSIFQEFVRILDLGNTKENVHFIEICKTLCVLVKHQKIVPEIVWQSFFNVLNNVDKEDDPEEQAMLVLVSVEAQSFALSSRPEIFSSAFKGKLFTKLEEILIRPWPEAQIREIRLHSFRSLGVLKANDSSLSTESVAILSSMVKEGMDIPTQVMSYCIQNFNTMTGSVITDALNNRQELVEDGQVFLRYALATNDQEGTVLSKSERSIAMGCCNILFTQNRLIIDKTWGEKLIDLVLKETDPFQVGLCLRSMKMLLSQREFEGDHLSPFMDALQKKDAKILPLSVSIDLWMTIADNRGRLPASVLNELLVSLQNQEETEVLTKSALCLQSFAAHFPKDLHINLTTLQKLMESGKGPQRETALCVITQVSESQDVSQCLQEALSIMKLKDDLEEKALALQIISNSLRNGYVPDSMYTDIYSTALSYMTSETISLVENANLTILILLQSKNTIMQPDLLGILEKVKHVLNSEVTSSLFRYAIQILAILNERKVTTTVEYNVGVICKGLQSTISDMVSATLSILTNLVNTSQFELNKEVIQALKTLNVRTLGIGDKEQLGMILVSMLSSDEWDIVDILDVAAITDVKLLAVENLVKRVLQEFSNHSQLKEYQDVYVSLLSHSLSKTNDLGQVSKHIEAGLKVLETQLISCKTFSLISKATRVVSRDGIRSILGIVNTDADVQLKVAALESVIISCKVDQRVLDEEVKKYFLTWLNNGHLQEGTLKLIFMTSLFGISLQKDLIDTLCTTLESGKAPSIVIWILGSEKNNSQIGAACEKELNNVLKRYDGNWAVAAFVEFTEEITLEVERIRSQGTNGKSWKNIYLLVGFAEQLVSSLDESIAMLEKLTNETEILESQKCFIQAHLGELYIQSREYDKAFHVLTQALLIRPDYSKAFENLCLCLCYQRKYSEARKEFESGPKDITEFDFNVISDAVERIDSYFSKKFEEAKAKKFLTVLLDSLKEHPDPQNVLQFMIKNLEYCDETIVAADAADWVETILFKKLESIVSDDKEHLSKIDEAWRCFQIYHNSYRTYNPKANNVLINVIDKYMKSRSQIENIPNILKFLCVDLDKMYVDLSVDINPEEIQTQWLSDRLKTLYGDNLPMELIRSVMNELLKTDLISDVETMESFLYCFGPENTTDELINFIRFLSEYKLGKEYLIQIINPLQKPEDRKLSEKQFELEALWIEEMLEKVWTNPKVRKAAVYFLFKLHADVRWSFSYIKEIVNYFQSLPCGKADICSQHLTEVFSVIYSYNLLEITVDKQGRSILKILKEEDPQNWQYHINTLALNTYYKDIVNEYNEDEFCQELINMNPTRQFVGEIIPIIKGNLKVIKSYMKVGLPNVLNFNVPVESWDKVKVGEWVKRARTLASKDEFLPEMVAVLCQATKIHKGFYPRTSQLVSLLLLLGAKTNGRMAKIGTGEGKSIVVVILACIRALQGRFVDVVTSSPVLAERDADEYEGLFKLVGVTAGHCFKAKDGNEFEGCYSYDVIYADSSTLEGDVLRHEFSKLGTRGDRKFHTVIVDEVDSMLLDQGGHSTRLVGQMPSMEYLEPVLALVWAHTNEVNSRVMAIGGENFLLEDESKGSVTSLVGALYANLPGDIKDNYKLNSAESLTTVLTLFAESAKAAELVSADFREAVIQVLDNTGNSQSASPISSLGKEDQIEAINKFIKKRWDVENERNFLFVAEKLLQSHILVFGENGLEGKFHSENHFHSDNEFERKLMFWYFDGKFLHLSPLLKRQDEIKDIVKEKVRAHLDLPNSKAISTNDLKFRIPNHLKEWCSLKLDKWVDSALTAKFSLVQDKDYVVKVNEEGRKILTPIDYENTGVVQDSTVWSDGVHQFLQFKHRISVFPENLPNNYLSNMSFFKKYGSQLYGLTGTLGSDPERALLSEIYNVDTIDVPTFKPRQYVPLRSVLAPSPDDWLLQVSSGVTAEVRKGRAVLVICKTIRDVYRVRDGIQEFVSRNGVPLRNLKIYVRSDLGGSDESSPVSQKLEPGEVVVATNLAGRGTDIKLTNEVIKNGGLHVCISYLPQNVRVEEQADGRASRQGQPGTSQLIISAETEVVWPDLEEATVEAIKIRRDDDEKRRIQKILSTTVPQLETDASIFDGYCFIREMEHSRTLLSAMDERFGIHLDQLKLRSLSNEDARKETDLFYQKLKSDHANNKLILNAAYDIQLGNQKMLERNYAEAIELYESAIRKDPNFCHNAHYYKAYCLIEQFKGGYKEKASKALTEAFVQIDYQMNVHIANYSVIEGKDDMKSVETEFGKQTVEKITLLQAQAKSIEQSLEQIGKHKEVKAEIRPVGEYLKDQNMPELPHSQLAEAQASGLCGFMIVEKRPPPWWAVLTVILVGVCQAVVGTVLAVVTGGAFGLGLVIEGIADIVSGAKAAIMGEYISLKDFFIEKGISLALSAVIAGAGAAAKSVAKFAATAVKNIATTAFGKAITKGIAKISASALGKAVKALVGRVSAIKTAGFNWIKAGVNRVKDGATRLVSRGTVWLKAKMQATWKWISQKLSSLGQKLGITKIGSKAITDAAKDEASRQIKNKVILGTKLIMSKLAKRGVKEFAEWATDKLLIDNIHEAIRGLVEGKVKETIQKELKDGKIGRKIDRILINPSNNTEHLKEIAALEFEEERNGASKFIKKVASMVLSAKPKIKRMQTTLQTILNLGKVFAALTIFSEFIAEVTSYLEKCFNKVDKSLDKIIEKYEIPDLKKEAGIMLQRRIDEAKNRLEKRWTAAISEKIADMVSQEFLKPVQSFAINKLTSNMFELEELKKKDDDEEDKEDDKKDEDKKDEEDKLAGLKKWLGLSPKQMADFTHRTGRSIELYALQDDQGEELKYVYSFGKSPLNDKKNPIRVVKQGAQKGKEGFLDLVVMDKKGKVAVVPLPKSILKVTEKSLLDNVLHFTQEVGNFWDNVQDLSELVEAEF